MAWGGGGGAGAQARGPRPGVLLSMLMVIVHERGEGGTVWRQPVRGLFTATLKVMTVWSTLWPCMHSSDWGSGAARVYNTVTGSDAQADTAQHGAGCGSDWDGCRKSAE